jgi:nitrate reductase NapE component
MPEFFHVLSQYFWLIALGFAAFNYRRADQAAAAAVEPKKLSEARAYLRNFALAAALPWVIMGVGQIAGFAPTVWHYFRPQDGNLFVVAWLATLFALSCLFAWWVFMADGAKKTVEFNLMAALGQHGSKPPSVNMIKFFAALGVVMFPIWVYLAMSMNTPLPA